MSTQSDRVMALTADLRSRERSFRRFVWINLGYMIAVILWGAFVRASGSGAGCGDHWPLCNGEMIPRSPRLETVIEFAHRLTSGLCLVLIATMVAWSRKLLPEGHAARRWAWISLGFVISEALVGAGLVLFELVAHDKSGARAVSIAIHLANMLLLLGSLTLTAWHSREGGPKLALRASPAWSWAGGSVLGAFLLVGVTGSIAALGDTLFPVKTLSEGFAQDFSPAAHSLIQLRIYHPIFAVATALALVAYSLAANRLRGIPSNQALRVGGLALAQVALGVANLLLLAPIAMQLLHVLVADALWISLIWLAAETISNRIPNSLEPAQRALPVAGEPVQT